VELQAPAPPAWREQGQIAAAFQRVAFVTPLGYNGPVVTRHTQGQAFMDSSPDIVQRLEALNRGPLPRADGAAWNMDELRRALSKLAERQKPPPAPPIVYQRDLPRHAGRPAPRRRLAGAPVNLEEALPGEAVEAPHGGQAYVVTRAARETGEAWAARMAPAFAEHVLRPGSALRRRLEQTCGLASPRPEDAFFLDLETLGLAGAPLFLAGVLTWEEGEFVARQYLARDYSEERAVVSLALTAAASRRFLVTFNGKSFDAPQLNLRAAASGVPGRLAHPHLDLLHESRRVWKNVLPDCRLQTLEARVCGRERWDDIPSHEIPEACHAFYRTGNAAEIVTIMKHNLLDLLTMADLALRLPPPPPPRPKGRSRASAPASASSGSPAPQKPERTISIDEIL